MEAFAMVGLLVVVCLFGMFERKPKLIQGSIMMKQGRKGDPWIRK